LYYFMSDLLNIFYIKSQESNIVANSNCLFCVLYETKWAASQHVNLLMLSKMMMELCKLILHIMRYRQWYIPDTGNLVWPLLDWQTLNYKCCINKKKSSIQKYIMLKKKYSNCVNYIKVLDVKVLLKLEK
jgi:hypothetical protein